MMMERLMRIPHVSSRCRPRLVRLQGTKYARQEGRHKLVQTFVDIVARDCGSVAPTIEAVGPLNAATWALCRRDLALQVTTRNRTNRKPIVGLPAIGEEEALIGHVR
jgi:hypothetical protein